MAPKRTKGQLRFVYEVRDSIHGLVRLTDQEMAIVNTQVFQRLRRISQLAMASLVYPGATHTRFEHSLGVTHVAGRIFERLARREQMFYADHVLVRLAALTHDIGHGPFSHVSESLLDRHYDRKALGTLSRRDKIHERITADLLTHDAELAVHLPEEQRTAVLEILQGGEPRDFKTDIVSSSLDADKMDYLLRDTHAAGVQYGHFDLDKVIDACLVRREIGASFLMIDEDGRFAAEQLVLSKHHMTQQVYMHRVRSITDAMIVRGLDLAIAADEGVRGVYAYDGTAEHRQRFVQADDARITAMVLDCADTRAREIFLRLRHRDLFKELALLPIDAVHFPSSVTRVGLLNLDEEEIKGLEEAVAKTLGREPWEVIVAKRNIKNPAYWAPGTISPEAIHVLSRDDTPRQLREFDDIVVAQLPGVEQLQVIGPRESWRGMDAKKRRRARQDLNGRLARVIQDRLRSH